MTDMLKELAEVVSVGNFYGTISVDAQEARHFLITHHAEIAQNAEAAKRLRALEQALMEREGVSDLRDLGCSKRADELRRERAEGKGDE